jgi:hypothetical protein
MSASKNALRPSLVELGQQMITSPPNPSSLTLGLQVGEATKYVLRYPENPEIDSQG